MKTDHLQQIRNQSENDDIPQEPGNLRFAPIIICFAFLIDIIEYIITNSPYYVTRSSVNGSAVSRDTDGNHVTSKRAFFKDRQV